MKTKILGLLAVGLLAGPMVANATVYTEDFEGTFPAWESGWFGVNSDAFNYYCPLTRGCSNRGNNPDGLWLLGVGGAQSGAIEVTFNNAFGPTITSLAIDVAGYTPTTLSAYDMANALIFQQVVTLTFGAETNPGIYSNYVINSSNGISRFTFSGSAAGNTSVDNIVVNASDRAVPEPGTLALLGLGLTGLALSRRRKAN